jgi:hypothetical protein
VVKHFLGPERRVDPPGVLRVIYQFFKHDLHVLLMDQISNGLFIELDQEILGTLSDLVSRVVNEFF